MEHHVVNAKRRQIVSAAALAPLAVTDEVALVQSANTPALSSGSYSSQTARPTEKLPGEPGATQIAAASGITNIAGRTKQKLDGRWKVILDPFDVVRKKPRDRRNVWKDQIEEPGKTIIEYEWETSPEIDVPGDWNTARAEMLFYEGTAYYRRLFNAKLELGRRYFLAFDAVNYRSTVWLNQHRLGGHEGGFTPFSFEVTDKIKISKICWWYVQTMTRHRIITRERF